MANFANNAVTDAGRLLLADLQAGAVFIPTKIVIGSGTIPSGETAATMTAVSSPVKELAINKKKKTGDGKVIVGGAYDNTDVTEAWYFRELALFARAEYRDEDGIVTKAVDEVLYSYGNAGDTADYMPAYSADTVVERQIDLVSWVGQSTEIELTIESGLQVTQEQKNIPGGVLGLDDDGNANMNGGTIMGLAAPVNDSDAATKEYADKMLPLAGGTMAGDVDMDGHGITGLPTPVNDSDAATKEYVDDSQWLHMECIWKNAAPTNSFTSQGHSLGVDLTKYTLLCAGFAVSIDSGGSIERWEFIPIVSNETTVTTAFLKDLNYMYRRVFAAYPNDNTVYFGSGYIGTNSMSQNDGVMIPVVIYGVRGKKL